MVRLGHKDHVDASEIQRLTDSLAGRRQNLRCVDNSGAAGFVLPADSDGYREAAAIARWYRFTGSPIILPPESVEQSDLKICRLAPPHAKTSSRSLVLSRAGYQVQPSAVAAAAAEIMAEYQGCAPFPDISGDNFISLIDGLLGDAAGELVADPLSR